MAILRTPARLEPQTLRAWTVPGALLLGAALLRLPTLAFPLTERHAFRQTQTAFPAVIYARQGIDLLHPEVPVFGPPWSLPFEFPLVQAIAAPFIAAGVPVEITMRSLSLAGFLATAAVLWLLLARHANRRTAHIALAAFLFSPFSLLWSRTSLIEYPTTFGALLFVLGILEWHRGHGRRWLVLAAVAGPITAAVKITTAAFWMAPSLFTRRIGVLVALIPTGLVSLAWTRWADLEKAANPNSAWLTSSALMNWNLGGDRLSISSWTHILQPTVMTAGMLLIPLGVLVIFRPERLLWGWMAIALVGPMLAFTNLYTIHDYYSAAITPAVAALIGGGADRLLQRVPWVAASLLIPPAVVLASTISYWGLAYQPADPEHVLLAAASIREATPNGELAAVECNDWTPAPLFYADRRGIILRLPGQVPPPGYVLIGGGLGCTGRRN